MANDEIRRATVALQHALDARTLEYQVLHAADARAAFDAAQRALAIRVEQANQHASVHARRIAERAVQLESQRLQAFAERLDLVEKQIAGALDEGRPPEYRRLLTFVL